LCLSKSPKQLPNCLSKKAETSIILIFVDVVLSEVRAYTVSVCYRPST
jgi:hypothetical protein